MYILCHVLNNTCIVRQGQLAVSATAEMVAYVPQLARGRKKGGKGSRSGSNAFFLFLAAGLYLSPALQKGQVWLTGWALGRPLDHIAYGRRG